MLKARKKFTKKEIKEDKFVKAVMETKAYLDENSKKVLTITAAVFAVVLITMFYFYMHSQDIEKSASLLGEAQLEYQNLNYPKAKSLLNRLLEEYSGTESAGQGTFLLANLYYQENNTQQAKELFEEFINSYSGSNILLASGYAGFAACIERESDFESAAENYLKAQKMAPDFVEAANYLYLAGRNYIKIKNYQKAKEVFEKIEKEYESSTRISDAKAQLILLANK